MSNFENILSISVRGYSHLKDNKPLQDYSLAVKNNDISIAVVCDGHGSKKYVRSEIGSELAAKVTKNALIDFFKSNPTWQQLNKNTEVKIQRLKYAILANWQTAIENYTAEHPFTAEELQNAASGFDSIMKYDVRKAYGTTALAAMICKDYYLVLMIGDGAIVKIRSDYTSEIITFPEKRIFDDQPHSVTDSLCDSNSAEHLHCQYQCISQNEKLAFGLCTDGMSEAFDNDDYLTDKIKNYLCYYATYGIDTARQPIENQLNELSRISPYKDDISLAFASIYLDDFAAKTEPNEKRSTAQDNTAKEAETDETEVNPETATKIESTPKEADTTETTDSCDAN